MFDCELCKKLLWMTQANIYEVYVYRVGRQQGGGSGDGYDFHGIDFPDSNLGGPPFVPFTQEAMDDPFEDIVPESEFGALQGREQAHTGGIPNSAAAGTDFSSDGTNAGIRRSDE